MKQPDSRLRPSQNERNVKETHEHPACADEEEAEVAAGPVGARGHPDFADGAVAFDNVFAAPHAVTRIPHEGERLMPVTFTFGEFLGARSVIGSTLAELVDTGRQPDLIAPFTLERFYEDDLVSELAAAAVSH